MRRARVLVTVAVSCGVLMVATPGAWATRAVTVTICASQPAMYVSPGGAKVGILQRGDHVRLLARSPGRAWLRVLARFGTRGWVRAQAICARHR